MAITCRKPEAHIMNILNSRNLRARQIHYRRGCPVGNQPLKYSCPVLNLVARDFSQIFKYKNIKYVSMKVSGFVQKIVSFESCFCVV